MRKVLTVVAVIVLIVLIGAGVVQYLNGDDPMAPDDQARPAEEAEGPVQPEWCPRVEFIAAPGTWESAADDDPFNPQANPHSFLLNVTRPLQERYAPDDVRVWTLPYSAQFANVQNQDQLTYDESREEGTQKVRERLLSTHGECPLTDFAMTGFSQGAVILGDIVNEIGNHRGPIPPERVRGVALLADGRRTADQGINPGNPVGGVGAEVSLKPVEGLVQNVTPGASMRGARDGFGALQDRTFQICASSDPICAAPESVIDGLGRALELANNSHAQYGTNTDVIPGTTADQWIKNWAIETIDQG
ncbi:cutinase family protein [Corynebacterium pseudodiphtheriticum]|uniref:cutinase family protein n=1 Tax=Corynebacterium pseudodiphtheriticum TaxID=37637 RepID=UPI00234D49F4|nr:cutinase family protein [Corynebacterium pseudodiphtheriticum]MDC7087419.1 cutinase family protein [Corynebacterium pseudodiphtheriticum]MDK4241815.1 cutinase family protein [Corynebacterium pseudodiphtheriticum]MDK4249932.1 cutinase family protein [Corynebacterium pseudodiphtheriticum]MDK8487436.1 cutinase family protein [Corynebacterium pseudodiphtheriticum]MDK8494703.1 cutinase family protein [Corynebacterium pseudodiphtheriticum]